jgi:hypothetical protein
MPPGWPATRARILDRDGHRCRWPSCPAPAAEVHHIRPGVEADHLLVSLCSAHHLRVTEAQAALARGATPPAVPGWLLGQPSPPPSAAGDRLRAVTDLAAVTGAAGDRTPRVTTPGEPGSAPTCDDAARRRGWGVTPPSRASAGGGTRARAKRGRFRPFWSPPVTGEAVVAGQRPARPEGPVACGDRHPAEPVTERVGRQAAPGRLAEPVTVRAGRWLAGFAGDFRRGLDWWQW